MGINFPASPTPGQVFTLSQSNGSTGPIYRYLSGAWRKSYGTALRANKLVNPVMQISQERQSLTNPIAAGGYGCDQWRTSYSTMTGIQASRTVLSPCPTPNGTPFCLGVYFGTAFPTLAAGTYFTWQQYLEGNRLADLAYGTAQAKSSVLRFWVIAPAGTYTVCIRNTALDRSWISPFTISPAEAGSWQMRTMVVPGETTGTWTTDNNAGGDLLFMFAASTDMQIGVPGWNAGNKTAVPGHGNAAAVVGWNVFIGDVGWHSDPNMTGVAPEFQMPLVEDDLQDCLRYWYLAKALRGVCTSATVVRVEMHHPVLMRAGPALSLVGAALRVYDGTAAAVNATSIATVNTTTQHIDMTVTASAGAMVAGRPGSVLVDGVNDPSGLQGIAVNARM